MAISPDAKPKLPRGVRLVNNEAQGGWVLLAPERVFKAEGPAPEVIKRCTGETTVTLGGGGATYSFFSEHAAADKASAAIPNTPIHLRRGADKRVFGLILSPMACPMAPKYTGETIIV